MPRHRTRLNWTYDEDRQEFTTPSGRVISLHEIAALLQDQLTNTHDFQGAWSGWRMRQNRLIAPGAKFSSSAITPQTLRAFTRWLSSYQGEQAQLEFIDKPTQTDHEREINEPSHDYGPRKPPAGRPALRLVHTTCR